MKPFIVCEHVDFGYENQDAVIDLSLAIYPGDYLCIVGANGSGKSTLVKGLLGLLTPTAGTLTVLEELQRGGIGYLPQQTAAQRDFPATVGEVVLSGTLSRRGNLPFYSRREKALALRNMERLGLMGLEKKCYRELSGGQQQRVLIARALCATEHMLILDEPTTGLDPSAIQDFYRLVRELNKKDHITIVMVSHDIRNVILQADRILHMQQQVLFLGTTGDYKKTMAGRDFLGEEALGGE
ncbi:MAG: metal ABC transporter ATP-binding protein [Lachnospiraceae bacterium]|jgi:zinc transport system ATP-binding protein|nr:metal ABC transporter ATP-binding protein [Lachnospiraceae bacterium]